MERHHRDQRSADSHWIWVVGLVFCCRDCQDLWQFYGHEEAGACPESLYPVCPGARRHYVWHGTDDSVVFHCAGIVSTIMAQSGMTNGGVTELPAEIVEKIEAVGMLESIPLWIVTLLGSLLITVLSFIMILTVYGRMFKLYMYTAIAPIPISTFAGEPSQSVGKNFIKSYAGVCLEGAIIALACIIFSVYSASPPAIGDTSLSAVTIVWNYVGELVFNLLVLVGAVKASDRIVREMMGL